MYYGATNPFYNYQDPKQLFEFYDDFEVWEGWVTHGSGVVSQSSEQAFQGNYSLKKSSHGDPNGGYKAIGKTITYPVALEAWIIRTTLPGANADRIGIIDDNGNGYGIYVNHDPDYVAIDKRTNYSATTYGRVDVPIPENEWYKAVFIWNNGNLIARVYDRLGSLIGEATYTDTQYSSFTRVYVFGGYVYYVDLMFLRKYIEPEPVYSIAPLIIISKDMDLM